MSEWIAVRSWELPPLVAWRRRFWLLHRRGSGTERLLRDRGNRIQERQGG